MLILYPLFSLCAYSDNDFVVTQELVDKINNNKKSTFNATLYNQFRDLKFKDVKSFLSPIRPSHKSEKSALPTNKLGTYIDMYAKKQYITGVSEFESNLSSVYKTFSNQPNYDGQYGFPIYNSLEFCSSWSTAITSAVSISVSRWAGSFINYSLQYILDCDPMGDNCVDRPIETRISEFLNGVPEFVHWSSRAPNEPPPAQFNYYDQCYRQLCYPGHKGCYHQFALSGNCNDSAKSYECPVQAFYHWRQIQEFLFEVGPVVSSVVVYPEFFTYQSGVYSSESFYKSQPIGMLDVTIVGWGEVDSPSKNSNDYWWYIIPHLGCEFGIEIPYASKFDTSCGSKGFMMFSRRFDDSWIESKAYAPIPYNFNPYF